MTGTILNDRLEHTLTAGIIHKTFSDKHCSKVVATASVFSCQVVIISLVTQENLRRPSYGRWSRTPLNGAGVQS